MGYSGVLLPGSWWLMIFSLMIRRLKAVFEPGLRTKPAWAPVTYILPSALSSGVFVAGKSCGRDAALSPPLAIIRMPFFDCCAEPLTIRLIPIGDLPNFSLS